MIRKLLFSANLFVLLFTASNLFAAAPISSNKLVYFSQFNTLRSTYPVSQSASNFNSSLVSSATIDYGGSGISPKDFPRTNWDITNASSTLDPATAPYVEYTINFSSNVNIDLDRFVITGGGSNYSTKFELRWSKDNYATRLGLFSFGSDWQYKLSSVNLNTLSNFTGTQLKFRLYFYDTNASGSNLIHSDTGPYPSLDGTPASYDIWTATAAVWVNPPPAISTITPSSGAIGSTVVINGTDFTGATTLSFNGTNATNFTVDSPTQITATVPVGTASGPITVTTPNGTGTSSTNFTVVSPPTIASFTPSSGPVGTSITVTGTNFTTATAVSIGGTPVTSFTINSATSITAIAGSGQTGKIAVTTPGGTAESTSNFTLRPTIITTGTSAITSFSACKNSPLAAQTFTVKGLILTAALTITSDDSTRIEFSTDDSTYSSSLSLPQTSGTVAETTVYVRLKSTSTVSSGSTTVTIASTGATSATFSFTRVIKQLPTVAFGTINKPNRLSTSFAIPYTATGVIPDQYSVTSVLSGFTPISNAALGGALGTLTIPIPVNSTPGNYNYQVTFTNSTTGCQQPYGGTLTITVVYPNISAISPLSAATGSTVTLTGNGFSTVLSENVISISGIKCTVLTASETVITFTVPPGVSTGKINYTNTATAATTISDEDFIAKFSYPAGITTLAASNYAGNGSVAVNSSNSFSGNTDRFSIADFNEDQKPDVLMYTGRVDLKYFTNGSNSGTLFQASDMASSSLYNQTLTSYNGSHALLGDFDADGDLDVFGTVGAYYGNWFKNTSSGGTISVNSIGDVNGSTNGQGVNTIDINRDGKLDWIGVNYDGNPPTCYMFLNSTANTAANFSFTGTNFSLTGISKVSRTADLDGNGFQDVIVGYTGALKIRPNINGVLTAASDLDIATTSTPYDIRVVDLDLDGKKDIVMTAGISTNPSLITVLKNTTANGTLSFATPVTFATGAIQTFGLAIADVNSDGLPDVLVGCSNRLVLFINNSTSGNISFLAAQNLGTAAANLGSLTAIDINGDGAMDIVGVTQNGYDLKYFVFTYSPEIIASSASLTLPTNCNSPRVIADHTAVSADIALTQNDLYYNWNGSVYALYKNAATNSYYISLANPNPGTETSVNNFFVTNPSPNLLVSNFPTNNTPVQFNQVTGGITIAGTVYSALPLYGMFTVSGTRLTTGVTITPPTFFEVSTDQITWAGPTITPTTLSLSPSNGTLSATPVYVRRNASVTVGTYTGNITLSSANVTTLNTAVSATIYAPIAITTQPSTTPQTICQNGTATALSVVITGSGVSFQWYKNTSASTTGATLITGATASSYTPLTTSASALYYYCVITGTCGSVTSNFSGLITVNALSVGGTATAAASSVCSGATTTLSLTGHAGSTIQWETSSDGTTGWTNATGGSGATTAIYTTPAMTTATYYRAKVTSSSPCTGSSYSTVASVSLNAATAITLQPSATPQNLCINGTPTDLSVTATGLGLTYQWYKNTTASTSGATLVIGATSSTYTPVTSTTSALYYYCLVTGTCGSVISGFTGIITVNPLPVISGSTTVGVGDAVTLTATTTAASSNAWVSSNPTIASVSNSGVLNGLLTGTTTVTYTNNNGCTDTEIISVTVGTTQPPILNLPATGTSGVSTLNISYTLPEAPLAGSVRLTFTPTAGGTPIVWTMTNATSAAFAYPVGSNPTSLSHVVSGSSLDFTTYNLTLSYQDVYGNPAALVTNTSIQFLAPPVNLSYSLPSTFTKDNVVTNIVPSITGTATSFSVSPALPSGLTLNTTTGVISGTPTVAATLSSYVVTATTSSGSTSATLSFAVDKATPTITSMAAITKTFGDAAFTLTAPTSNGTGAFTFASTDTAVATISGTTVTIVGVGTATITATQATDANYLAGSTSTTLTVGKATPVLSNFNAITTTIDSSSFTLTAPTSSGGTGAISYTSSNTAVATISGTTVTIVGAGTAIITATQASDINYNSVSITALLTVGVGTTQPPILTSPTTGISGVSTLNIIYTLPETPLAGSVSLIFTPTAGGTPIVWTMTNTTSATFAYPVGSNPTLLSQVVTGSPLAFATYNLTLSYQDVYGNPAASVTNTSIQFLAPPSITLANTSYSGLINTVFTTITVTSSGGAVSSFTISPNLPAGLTLNTTTGSISGTPTVDLTATNFTLTATNPSGTASVQFTLLIDTAANNQIVDTDGDGVLDSIDTDDDGDGVLDVNDAFPINKNEWTDTDRDGIGNNADTDDDNDGILDGCDVDINGDGIPDNGTDLDGDGINDGCDQDKDGDGVNNASDNCPSSPNRDQADRDHDGLGDVCDTVELNVSEAITPNGDGINDTWMIYNIENHPGTIVRVFNKWGKEVFYSNDYKNDWNGHYRDYDKSLPSSGSYLYQIDLGGDGSIDEQGWIYITK